MPKSSILVVDDEPFNFDVVELYLRGLDYNLHYAASGKMALDCLDSYQPDIILLDVMMPEMDGIAKSASTLSPCQNGEQSRSLW